MNKALLDKLLKSKSKNICKILDLKVGDYVFVRGLEFTVEYINNNGNIILHVIKKGALK